MADPQVSPLETTLIRLELISSLSPEAINTGHLGTPYAAEPAYNGPNPDREAWNRVDRDSVIPVGVAPVLGTRVPLTAMENGGPLRRPVDMATVDSLNRHAFATFIYQSDQWNREMYRGACLPSRGAQLALIPGAFQLPLIAQNVQASPSAENHLSIQAPTAGQSITMSPPTVAHLVATEHPILHVQSAVPNGLGSIHSFSAAFVSPPAALLQLLAADQVAYGKNMQAETSQTSTVSSALGTGSPSNRGSLDPSPNTSPEDSPHQGSGLSEHSEANFGQKKAGSTMTRPHQGLKSSFFIGRVEQLSNNEVNGTIEPQKGKFDAQETKAQEPRSSSCSRCESDLDSESDSPPTGFVRDPITGKYRKRGKMDDSPKCMKNKYRARWNEQCGKTREDRGTISGYEDGDSDFDFDEWKKAKRERRKTKKRKRFGGGNRD